ncbi:MAG: hypothetical protein HRU70_07215 [Phycisphaeraceae bacterium]|nr:MAG: hypothetical protein HRU70_07215 [Phycisphaeraceae bacterium]
MKRSRTRTGFAAALAVAFAAGLASHAHAQPVGTGFTYQGQLVSSGNPVDGTADFRFKLFPSAAGGAQIGSTLQALSIAVQQGRFSVVLDFNDQFPGDQRFLEIDVRSPAGVGGFTTLAQRQAIRPSPYAIRSLNAAAAPWTGLTDIPAGFADGIDNDTQYTAGQGLTLNGTTFSIGPHTHSANDIISGVLPTAFGGTGANTPEIARVNLGVPGLLNNNIFQRGQNIFLSSNEVGLTIRGTAGQGADLQQWVDGAGNIVARITSAGQFSNGGGGGGNQLVVSYSYKAFRPTRNTTNYTTDNGLQLGGGAGLAEVVVPLDYPNGTVINSITFYAFDNTAAVMTCAISRQVINAASITNLDSGTSTNNATQVLPITINPNITLDTNAYSYYIRAYWELGLASNVMAFYGAKVTYTLP